MKVLVFAFAVGVLQVTSGACERTTVQATSDASPLTVFFSTSDACCRFNDQRIVGATVESPDERDLAYNDTHFWVVLTVENMTNGIDEYDLAYNYTCKTDPRVCSLCFCYQEGIHLQLQSAAKPESSIALADTPEDKRGLHELAWIIAVVCVVSAMAIVALLAAGQIGKRLRRPRQIPDPPYEIVGGRQNVVAPVEPVEPPSSSEDGSVDRNSPSSQTTSSSGGLQFPMDVSPNLSSGEHQPVANGNDGPTNQVAVEVHPPVATPTRDRDPGMGPATGTKTPPKMAFGPDGDKALALDNERDNGRGPPAVTTDGLSVATGVGSAVSHTTGVNGTSSVVSRITGVGSAVSHTTGIGVGSAVSNATGVNGIGSALSHITGIDGTASWKSVDTGVGIAPPYQPLLHSSAPQDVSVSPGVRVMGKPRAQASPALSIIMSSEYSSTGPGTSIGSLKNTEKTPLLDSLDTDA